MNSIDYAIKMEQDGERFYLKQAEKNENSLKAVFMLLANDEHEHAKLLATKLNRFTYHYSDNDMFEEFKNVFSDNDDFRLLVKQNPAQLDVYKQALENEQKSVKLYQEMLDGSSEESDRKLFEYLVRQEKAHYQIFEDLVTLVGRPEEWVESAEFGIREEY